MEEIKLWAIEGSEVETLNAVSGTKSEKFLEDALVKQPDLLLEDLILVGRQTPTEGGPLDLLGVDGNGRLVVFELKRGTLSRDAVAQVIDYASDLDGMELNSLTEHISQMSGNYGIEKIENFQDWYSQGFGELESLKPLRMFLVGLGVDDRTERMVKFLTENSGMDISLLTFHGFNYEGKTILAKRVEVDGAVSPSPNSKKQNLSKEERLGLLKDLARDFGAGDTFSKVRGQFLESWQSVSEIVRTNHTAMRLRRNTSFIWHSSIVPESGRVRIFFYPWTIERCEDAFESAKAEIPYETRYYNNEWGDGIDFLIEQGEWETHGESLAKLIQSIYEAWEDRE